MADAENQNHIPQSPTEANSSTGSIVTANPLGSASEQLSSFIGSLDLYDPNVNSFLNMQQTMNNQSDRALTPQQRDEILSQMRREVRRYVPENASDAEVIKAHKTHIIPKEDAQKRAKERDYLKTRGIEEVSDGDLHTVYLHQRENAHRIDEIMSNIGFDSTKPADSNIVRSVRDEILKIYGYGEELSEADKNALFLRYHIQWLKSPIAKVRREFAQLQEATRKEAWDEFAQRIYEQAGVKDIEKVLDQPILQDPTDTSSALSPEQANVIRKAIFDILKKHYGGIVTTRKVRSSLDTQAVEAPDVPATIAKFRTLLDQRRGIVREAPMPEVQVEAAQPTPEERQSVAQAPEDPWENLAKLGSKKQILAHVAHNPELPTQIYTLLRQIDGTIPTKLMPVGNSKVAITVDLEAAIDRIVELLTQRNQVLPERTVDNQAIQAYEQAVSVSPQQPLPPAEQIHPEKQIAEYLPSGSEPMPFLEIVPGATLEQQIYTWTTEGEEHLGHGGFTRYGWTPGLEMRGSPVRSEINRYTIRYSLPLNADRNIFPDMSTNIAQRYKKSYEEQHRMPPVSLAFRTLSTGAHLLNQKVYIGQDGQDRFGSLASHTIIDNNAQLSSRDAIYLYLSDMFFTGNVAKNEAAYRARIPKQLPYLSEAQIAHHERPFDFTRLREQTYNPALLTRALDPKDRSSEVNEILRRTRNDPPVERVTLGDTLALTLEAYLSKEAGKPIVIAAQSLDVALIIAGLEECLPKEIGDAVTFDTYHVANNTLADYMKGFDIIGTTLEPYPLEQKNMYDRMRDGDYPVLNDSVIQNGIVIDTYRPKASTFRSDTTPRGQMIHEYAQQAVNFLINGNTDELQKLMQRYSSIFKNNK